jgi:hypothetical protein
MKKIFFALTFMVASFGVHAQTADHVAGAIEYGAELHPQPVTFEAYVARDNTLQPAHDSVSAVCMGSDPRACRPGQAFCNIDVVGFRRCLSEYADRVVRQPKNRGTVILVQDVDHAYIQ